MKNFFLLLVLHILLTSVLFGQESAGYRPGEMVVHLTKGTTPTEYMAKLNRLTGGGAGMFLKKTIVAEWNVHLIGFDENFSNPQRLLEESWRMPEIHFAQWNNLVEDRNVTPNDPDWFLQNDLSLINAPEAWVTSTGGLTPMGDTIVVAILEKGALLTHPDLAPNRYWNWADEPNDSIDNDGNGFIDDRGGWNPTTEKDDTGNNGFHGTGVFGVIGAVGNNNYGVAGINWNIKMLNISGVFDVADILEGYYYVYNMRRLYNTSNGAKGAFIVATNASFGYDNIFPTASTEHTNWCSFYDSLGRVGVLSAGATTNSNTDVDVFGDMPTSCGSEFLITVNNVNSLGARINSGYGKSSIDLGAPGTGTYTTYNSGNTPQFSSSFGGTSAATAHVTGAVGLLYSLGCDGFTSDALSEPTSCARRVRDAILNNTQLNTDLVGITVTGGHLDLKRAIDGVTKLCTGAVGRLAILDVRTLTSGNEVKLFYQTPIFLPYKFRVFNMLGQQLHEEELQPEQFYENFVRYDFTHLPRGVYVLSISRGNAIVSVKFPKI